MKAKPRGWKTLANEQLEATGSLEGTGPDAPTPEVSDWQTSGYHEATNCADSPGSAHLSWPAGDRAKGWPWLRWWVVSGTHLAS